MLGTLEGIGAVVRDDDDRTIGSAWVWSSWPGPPMPLPLRDAGPSSPDRPGRQPGKPPASASPTDTEVHYLAQVESPNPVQVRDYSGLKLPMHVGPSGLCMMSLWPDDDVNRYSAAPAGILHTAYCQSSPTMIKKRLEEIRATRATLDPRRICRRNQLGRRSRLRSGPCGHWERSTFTAPPTAFRVHGPDAIARLVMDAAERVSARAHSYTREPTSPAKPTNPRRNGK